MVLPIAPWRTRFAGIMWSIRMEAVLFFVVLAITLDTLIMPWALDTHPLVHLRGAGHLVRVTRHAPLLLRHAGTIALTVLIAAATLAHEFGHALALRRAGASEIEITIYGAGGACRAQARDTTPLALLWCAAAGPLVTIALVIALLGTRIVVPGPHTMHALLWLGAAIQVGTLALNVLPVLSRSDGGHMVRALTELLGGGRTIRLLVAAGLTLPVLTLVATLQADQWAALFWSAVTVLLAAAMALIAWVADRRLPAAASGPRPQCVGSAISLWSSA